MAKKNQNWCRGPESNWLRPPFQGGALPLSYPGNRCNSAILESARRLVKCCRTMRSASRIVVSRAGTIAQGIIAWTCPEYALSFPFESTAVIT